MTEAVVRTIGHTKLSSEQVRRVVEAANHAAFANKYAATTGNMRAVDFDGGPADPAVVLEALKTASAPEVRVAATMDYMLPPGMQQTKTAGAALSTGGLSMRDIQIVREKLANLHEELTASAEASRNTVVSSFVELSKQASRALHGGARADDLAQAWAAIDPDMAKAAMERLGLSLTGTKTAARINPDHGVITAFSKLSAAMDSYHAFDAARANVETELGRVSDHILGRVAA